MVRRFVENLIAKIGQTDLFPVYQLLWLSQEEKMKLKGRQVAAARELLGLSQTDLAAVTGVARSTISRFEAGEGDLKPSTLAEIQAELERRGIEFSNGTGTGVRLDHAKAEEFARQSGQTQKEADR